MYSGLSFNLTYLISSVVFQRDARWTDHKLALHRDDRKVIKGLLAVLKVGPFGYDDVYIIKYLHSL